MCVIRLRNKKSHKPHLKFTIDHTWNAEANAFQICLPAVVLISFLPPKLLNELNCSEVPLKAAWVPGASNINALSELFLISRRKALK